MSETMLGGTFPDYEGVGLSPEEEISAFAGAIWGNEFDGENNPRWWHVDEVGGMKIGGEVGGVTNGKEYFTLDPEVKGYRRVDLAGDGSVFGITKIGRSSKTGELVWLGRTVFFMND